MKKENILVYRSYNQADWKSIRKRSIKKMPVSLIVKLEIPPREFESLLAA
jgi:hypothetical protein